ncbi:MAG: bifunctional methylenetetrahydrofolate dehydrogenase/methenyltetrahydrofolate cyclohydrolase FolD [Candidatus Accumulibacter sp.]|jgi:methylenetetrahydrofolate dehydrogenase (NADP+)/methenyltetrahydrofolate cyclohydrolase|nr:bifunctional methylenetetrahydrofolate dehydrogenase/methenyltetrahydrofolate cyclohydrolase FolD [Accumulibacter sp.]
MTARILDGKALSQKLRSELAQSAASLADRGVLPGLAVVLVGDDPPSQVYVRNKLIACERTGIRSWKYEFPADVPPQRVFDKIAELNADPTIHGVLVQLPLPDAFDPDAVVNAIAPEKDVDGFRPENVGAFVQGNPRFVPCTPQGIMKFFESESIDLAGKEAVVVGRSNIVGKPTALLLMHAGATVTICHSKTRDLASHCRRADILVAAVGKPRMISADMVKPGAVVIDVGINRIRDGRLCGDVDFERVKEKAAFITPVPGGVGPMTITMLLANTVKSAERAFAQKP